MKKFIGCGIILGGVVLCITLVGSFVLAGERDISGIYVHAGSGVDFAISVVLTDPDGRRSGLASVPLDMNVPEPIPGTISEIPNSSVGYDAIENRSGEKSPGTLGMNVNHPADGNYLLEITGTKLTKYSAGINTYAKDGPISGMDFNGVTDENVTSSYRITYHSGSEDPSTIVRMASFESIQKELDLSFKVDWIKNAGLKNSLLKKLQNAEAAQNRGDSTAAENKLNAFLNEIKAQAGKGIDPDAVEMFEQEAQYILDHL
jgi:hypothetical protein